MSLPGPFCQVAPMQRYGSCRGTTGWSAARAGTAALDPNQTHALTWSGQALKPQLSDMFPQPLKKQLDRRRQGPTFQRDDSHWKSWTGQSDWQFLQPTAL